LDTYDEQPPAFHLEKIYPTDTIRAVLKVNEAAVRTFGWQNTAVLLEKKFGKGKIPVIAAGVIKEISFENLHKPVEALMISYSQGKVRSLSFKIDAKYGQARGESPQKKYGEEQ